MAYKRRTIKEHSIMPQESHKELAKTARFNVRATSKQAALIRAGALRRGARLTDYIIDSLCTQAEMDLADQAHFVLTPQQWKAFTKALDAPPKVPAGLKRLFSLRSLV